MSKPVKELVRKELVKRFAEVESLVIAGFTGLDAVATNQIRGRLRGKGITVTVVKNSLARQAFREVGIAQVGDVLDGPCAVVCGGDGVVDVVRELMDIGKESPALTVKAALLDGEVFGSDRVEELSKYPTRDEAIAGVVACMLAPAGKIAACLLGPGGKIVGILKTIEENQGGSESDAESDAEAA